MSHERCQLLITRVSWLLLLVSLPFIFFVIYKTPDTNYDTEKVYRVEDMSEEAIHGAAVPKGHHTERPVAVPEEQGEEKAYK